MGTFLTVVLCIVGGLVGLWILWNLAVLSVLTYLGRNLNKAFAELSLDGPVFPKIETRTVKGRLA